MWTNYTNREVVTSVDMVFLRGRIWVGGCAYHGSVYVFFSLGCLIREILIETLIDWSKATMSVENVAHSDLGYSGLPL